MLFSVQIALKVTGIAACVTLLAGLPAAAQGAPTSAAENFPNPTGVKDYPFDKALSKWMTGEGGDGGIGFTASGPVFQAPAMTEAQLRAALVGNTVRKDLAIAFYFNPDGTVEGWKREWSKAVMSSCPTQLSDTYEIEDGICYTALVRPISGRYSFRDGKICMPSYSGKPADGAACYYMGLLTKFVVIGDGKRMFGSGKDLMKGRVLAAYLPSYKTPVH